MPDTATVSRAQLDSFFGGLQAKLDALKHVQELYEPQLATRFSAFQWIDLNENGLSAQLAYFLDPRQTHAQGDKFLRVFLAYLQDSIPEVPTDPKKVSIRLEAPTTTIEADRRIDLLITLFTEKGEFGIGIENKIWAGDQKDQLKDYNSHLSEAFGKDYLLIYLTPYTKNIDANTIPEQLLRDIDGKHFLHLTYSADFAHRDSNDNSIFTRWIQVCEAEKVRWYLKDLNTYLLQQKFGEQTMEERDEMLSYIKENPALQPAIFSVLLDADYLLDSLIKGQVVKLCDHVKNLVDFTIQKIEIPDSIKVKQGGFYLYVEGWNYFCIGFEFKGANFNHCYYGLCTIEDSDQQALEYAEQNAKKLKSVTGLEHSSKYWPASAYLPKYQTWDEEVLKEFLKGESGEIFPLVARLVQEVYDKSQDVECEL